MKNIYLDYAAATPIDPKVLSAMEPYFGAEFYNPSAIYLPAIKIRKALEAARAKVAAWLGARPSEIYFTAGATEANNLAIQGLMRQYPDGELLVCATEHESVLAPAQLFKYKLIPVNGQGVTSLAELEKMVTPKTFLISVAMVNNELGTVQPIKEIAALVKKIREAREEAGNGRPLYLHADAAQAGNLFNLHTHRLGVDMMSINGGKIYGPKQTGALFVDSKARLEPIVVGGGQERGLRSGTENVPGVIGLSKALDAAQKIHAKEFKRIEELKRQFIAGLIDMPSVQINGSKKRSSPHIVSATFFGQDGERLMMQLDEANVQVANGSACSASSGEPSHVLAAIGLSEDDARSTLRFSFGRPTTTGDIEYTLSQLQKFLSVKA